MTKRNIFAFILLFVFILSGCQSSPAPSGPPPTTPATETEAPPIPEADPVADAIAQMSDQELAGQLLVAGIEGTRPGADALQAIQDLHVGGIILFGRNVESASQLTELTNGLKALNQEAGNVPLFLCVDEEGGSVSRMPPEIRDLPSAYEYLRAGGDTAALGRVLARECAAFGFQVDFAPVLDVWSNPNNTVIGKRAFAADPETVAAAGDSCAQAIMDAGVIPVVKHFPGHGDTATDSHVGLPVVDKTQEELEAMELIPFQEVTGGNRRTQDPGGEPALAPIPAVMVSHILMTQLDPLLPASLSPEVVTGLLREEMGFDGVVFTDDLTMGAITQSWPVEEAAILALQAGCDMVLVCHGDRQVQAAHQAILAALQSGDLTRQRLEESVRRVLELKSAYGVTDAPVETPDLKGLNDNIRAILP